MRVLIIDDDKLVCVSLKVILEADPDIEVDSTIKKLLRNYF